MSINGRKMIMVLTAAVIAVFLPGAVPAQADLPGRILPQSSTRYLSDADLAGLSIQELNYARNEIFAKYGRRFKSKELMDYFQTRPWYNGTEDPAAFDARSKDVLNKYEKANSTHMLEVEKSIAPPDGYKLDQNGYDISNVRNFRINDTDTSTPVNLSVGVWTEMGTSFSYDLDGDGTKDQISLAWSTGQFSNEPENFWITVNGINSKAIHCSSLEKTIRILNLDGKNLYLVVYDYGPSDDPLCTFFQYRNGSVVTAGQIDCYPGGMTVNDGVINATRVCKIFSTFSYNIKWKADGNGDLSTVPEDWYSCENTHTQNLNNEALQSFPVYAAPAAGIPSGYMDPQPIMITATDGENWVYLKGQYYDQEGWFNCGDYSSGSINTMFRLAWAD